MKVKGMTSLVMTVSIPLTLEQFEDVELFKKKYVGCKLDKFVDKFGQSKWLVVEEMNLLGMGTEQDFKDYGEGEPVELSADMWKKIAPFHARIESITKNTNKPFSIRLKSGLFIHVAPRIDYKGEKDG